MAFITVYLVFIVKLSSFKYVFLKFCSNFGFNSHETFPRNKISDFSVSKFLIGRGVNKEGGLAFWLKLLNGRGVNKWKWVVKFLYVVHMINSKNLWHFKNLIFLLFLQKCAYLRTTSILVHQIWNCNLKSMQEAIKLIKNKF